MPDPERYRVLAELFRTGPTSGLCRALDQNHELRGLLPGDDVIRDEDEMASGHHSMFGFNVFPHASVFLEDDGFLGKDTTASVREFYEASGLFAGDDREEADHITSELLFCSKLAGDALIMADFCDNHLLAWLPPFVFAIERQKSQFYARLARFTMDQIIRDRISLSKTGVVTDKAAARAPEENIVDLLSVASKCGLFLSRADITTMARSLRLPTGFGGRIQMLRTMFDSSESYEKREDLGAGIARLCDEEIARWNSILHGDSPDALHFWSRKWIEKLHTCRTLLVASGSVHRP